MPFCRVDREGDFLVVFKRVDDESADQTKESSQALPGELRVRKLAETYLERVSTNHAFTAFDLLDDMNL